MKRLHAFLLAAASAVGWSISPLHAPPAAAADPLGVLVTNQYAGSTCQYNESVLISDPFTGKFKRNLGKVTVPSGRPVGALDEAKPFDLNRKVVALWGGSSEYNQAAAIGVYDMVDNRWSQTIELPSAFALSGGKNPHSVTNLPDGNFAVAQVGALNGSGSGYVVIVSPSGQVLDSEPLDSAHGVEYDGQRKAVFAVGYKTVAKYTYASGNLSHVTDYALPHEPLRADGRAGGHDIRRRRTDNDFYVTADYRMWIFRPDAGTKFDEITKNGQPLGGVKSVDQRFSTTSTEYSYWKDNRFHFLDGTPSSTSDVCLSGYKHGRWIWQTGHKVYPEDVDEPEPNPGTWTPAFRVGAGANAYWIEVFTDADVTGVDVIGKDGQFYLSLAKQAWGGWTGTSPTALATGDNMKFVARRSSDGSTAASITFDWLQNATPATEPGWASTFTLGGGINEWWIEVYVSSAATHVETRVNASLWTALTKQSYGAWAKSMNAPAGSKVIIRAVRADGAKAYSPIYTWLS